MKQAPRFVEHLAQRHVHERQVGHELDALGFRQGGQQVVLGVREGEMHASLLSVCVWLTMKEPVEPRVSAA
ncbi:hypothetical protein Bpla01_42300 [Burkholderia plantarii]|nr:hypothetical protein Bpla01_42300 [Burkholderia plantarii]